MAHFNDNLIVQIAPVAKRQQFLIIVLVTERCFGVLAIIGSFLDLRFNDFQLAATVRQGELFGKRQTVVVDHYWIAIAQ